ncbi:hypothetical protein Tco_1134724 [Tanacetum coccineum]
MSSPGELHLHRPQSPFKLYPSGPSTPSSYFFRTITTSKSILHDLKKCRVHKQQALACKEISVTQGNNGYCICNPEQTTVNSAALLRQVLNEMEKLDLE